MSSITELSGNGVGSSKWLWTAVFACVFAIFSVWLAHVGGSAQATNEMHRNAEIAAESRALCEKWGMPAGSAQHAECLADIKSVRDHQSQRVMQDIDY